MKTVQNPSIPSSDYRDLLLTQLVESPTNPRQRYDEASLKELAESIRAQGILAPLLVREVADERFEIVAGSRRFRAAQLAGATSVPVRVVRLSDAEAIVAQVVENLQRENIHPLEEARGFRALLDLPSEPFAVQTIAAKSGKSPQYVAQRLRLTELIPPVAEAFLADKLTTAHALLIAKLPPEQQGEAFKSCFKTTWMTSGQAEILIPARELAGWIESNLLLDLQTAPFDRAQSALVPEAGSCHDCAKRTGANTLLFPESDADQCLDRSCYHTKIAAHIAQAIQQNPHLIQISAAWGADKNGVLGRGRYVEIVASRNGRREQPPERRKCPHMTSAIFVEGAGCGHIVTVCADSACDIHHGESRKTREARERTRAEQHKQDERRKEELTTRKRVLAAAIEKVNVPLSKADLELIARAFMERLSQDERMVLAERRSGPATTGKQPPAAAEMSGAFKRCDETGYSRLLIEMALLECAHNPYLRDGAARLEAAAKRYRVNVEKITASVAAEFAARRKKREKDQKNRKAARTRRGRPRKKSVPVTA